MGRILLGLCAVALAVAFLILTAAAFHRSRPIPAPSPKMAATPVPETKQVVSLDGNYVLTLYPAGKEGAQICVVVATPEFSVQNAQPFVRFSGRLQPKDAGNYLVDYELVSANDKVEDYAGTGTKTSASVLLRLGEPAQIIKNNAQFYNLRLDRYNNAAAKARTVGPDVRVAARAGG